MERPPTPAPRRDRRRRDRELGRLRARLAVETDARRELAGRVDELERRLDALEDDDTGGPVDVLELAFGASARPAVRRHT